MERLPLATSGLPESDRYPNTSMLILCIFGGIVQKIIGVTVVYTENICSRHFLIKIGRHILCMKSYGISDSELTHYPNTTYSILANKTDDNCS